MTGLSAAWWYGIRLAGKDNLVTAASPRIVHVDGPRGVLIHETPLDHQDVVVVSGLNITSPARAAWDVATLEDYPMAVATIDAMLHSGVLHTSDLTNRIAMSGGLWRVSRARQVLDLVDGRSESPPESRLRVTFIEAGLPAAVPQYEVQKNGVFVARVDLAWPAARVAVEYDGAHHADPLQMRRDRRRLNALVDAGWLVIHATAGDLYAPDTLIKQVSAALRGRAA
ncbi:MAG: endonuclease domain-containing protein [Geodermatophilaceae bacterium]